MSLTLRIDVPRRDLLSSNGRYHHYERARRAREIRTRAALIKRFSHRDVRMRAAALSTVIWFPEARHRDATNWQPTIKACVDGIVTGPSKNRWPFALLPDDDQQHLLDNGTRIDVDRGLSGVVRFELTFSDLAGTARTRGNGGVT